jgi:hypothetical protein
MGRWGDEAMGRRGNRATCLRRGVGLHRRVGAPVASPHVCVGASGLRRRVGAPLRRHSSSAPLLVGAPLLGSASSAPLCLRRGDGAKGDEATGRWGDEAGAMRLWGDEAMGPDDDEWTGRWGDQETGRRGDRVKRRGDRARGLCASPTRAISEPFWG